MKEEPFAGPSDWVSNYGTGDIPRRKETEFFGPPWDPKAHAVIPAKFVRYPGEFYGGWSPWDTVHRFRQEILWWKQYLAGDVTASARN